MTIPDPSTRKPDLRTAMRQASRDPRSSAKANADLVQWLNDRPELCTIAIYSPLPGEVDFSEIIQRRSNFRWVFPRVCDTGLAMHHVPNPPDRMSTGAFNILEPDPALPEIEITEIDAFICPGLAFDPMGGRLGRGRGFYDQLLAKARPGALKVGACFANQWVATTHSEPHDVPMDHVIVG